MAQSLYKLLFSWLIERVNVRYCQDDCDTFLGVLDIPGFKGSFLPKKTGPLPFHQFLFNYANEKIRVFTNIRFWSQFQVQAYSQGLISEEGFSTDNTIVELIASSSTGIVSVIDSETFRALQFGSESPIFSARLADKLNERYAKTPNFKSAKIAKRKGVPVSSVFTIFHYAETPISYEALDFFEHNLEKLSPDVVSLFRGNDEIQPSNSKFIRSLFTDEAVSTQVLATNTDIVTSAQINNPSRKPSTKKKRKGKDGFIKEEEEPVHLAGVTTVASSLVSSLDELCEALSEADTWVQVCILPHDLSGKKWDSSKVKKQIKFYGLTDLIHYQAKNPYMTSYSYNMFIEKFKTLFKAGENPALPVLNPKEVCADFRNEFQWSNQEVSFGDTEIFVNYSTWNRLNERLENKTKKNFSTFRTLSD